MSLVTVADVQTALVIEIDDPRIQLAIDDAESWACQYLDVPDLTQLQPDPTADPPQPDPTPTIRRAVILIVSTYIDTLTVPQIDQTQTRAETLLYPLRKLNT